MACAQEGEMNMQVSVAKCKKRLTTLWLAGSGFLFLVLLFQTVFGAYGEVATEAWSWLMPSIMPTVSLIIGVWVMDVQGKGVKVKAIDRFVFQLAFSLSALYLLVLALMILLQPFISQKPPELIRILRLSNYGLSPFQGLVSASIGAFFVKRELKV
jgi:hypothetical protein